MPEFDKSPFCLIIYPLIFKLFVVVFAMGPEEFKYIRSTDIGAQISCKLSDILANVHVLCY